jgi:hypothetical protein
MRGKRMTLAGIQNHQANMVIKGIGSSAQVFDGDTIPVRRSIYLQVRITIIRVDG